MDELGLRPPVPANSDGWEPPRFLGGTRLSSQPPSLTAREPTTRPFLSQVFFNVSSLQTPKLVSRVTVLHYVDSPRILGPPRTQETRM